MSSHYQGPKPNGTCVFCRERITPGWDTSRKGNSNWFCSDRCILEDWLDWAQVPHAYWTFDPTLPSCGPDRIRLAEDWIKSHLEFKDARPGLLLHSARSGTGKTRVATHAATLRMLPWWEGHERVDYEVGAYGRLLPGVWLNALRFRQKYQETLHPSKAAERIAWVDGLCRCTLLVLDEPDKLKPSEGLVEIIYGILDERFANNRMTILTTNAGGPELERRWGPEYGPYLVRRIREFCLAIDFDP
jgi:hypothetical protein